MIPLVLVRHGQSAWNLENRFTGWIDVDLSPAGVEEATQAGQILREKNYSFDLAFTSVLLRANRTLDIIQKQMNLPNLPVVKSWRLNERHYGALQGLNKAEMAQKFGDQQVHIWRRSYDIRPPALDKSSPMYPGRDPLYQYLAPSDIPLTECLKDTVARCLPFWHELIAPAITQGKKIIIAAHGNSIRALVKYLDNIPDSEIVSLNIPTGVPLVYEMQTTPSLKPLRHFYLGDPDAIQKAINAVANQAQKNK